MGNGPAAGSSPKGSKRTIIIVAVLLVVALAVVGGPWVVGRLQPDDVTAAAPATNTARDFRVALSGVIDHSQAAWQMNGSAGYNESDGSVLLDFTVPWDGPDGHPTDLSTLDGEKFAAPMNRVLAIAKATECPWQTVTYHVMVDHDARQASGSTTALNAVYSHSNLSGINLTRKKGRALVEAANSYQLDPNYPWSRSGN